MTYIKPVLQQNTV